VFLWAVVSAALRARRRPQVGGGREELLGSVAQVESWPSATAAAGASGETGWVRLQGELWRARSALPLAARQAVRVVGVDGLTLEVEELERQADNSQNQGGER
jgi:membrane-bound serine protease (ClpP class)